MDLLCFCSVLCLLCLCARLFICALSSPTGKGLNSWLSFVVSNYEFVTFPLVSWVRYGTWCIDSWSLHPYLLPIHLRSRTIAQIPTFLSLKRLKSFGHLSNNLKKTRLGSHHSEKTEFLRQILRKRPTFVIGNSNQHSHVKTTLCCPWKG